MGEKKTLAFLNPIPVYTSDHLQQKYFTIQDLHAGTIRCGLRIANSETKYNYVNIKKIETDIPYRIALNILDLRINRSIHSKNYD